MKKLLVVALATMMTQQAMAANWYFLGENNIGKDYIDLDSIQADTLANGTPVMTAWIRTEYKQAQNWDGGKKYWSVKYFNYFDYFDCRARKSAIEYYVAYDKQGGVVDNGNNPTFSHYSSANWNRAVPGTASEALLSTACAYAN